MSQRLVPQSIVGPGNLGLNRSASAVNLEPQWALEINNAVFDATGRVTARKGWTNLNTVVSGNPSFRLLHEFIKQDGSTQIVSAAGGKLYTGTSSLTERGTGYSGDTWKAATLGDYCFLFQRGIAPKRWSGTTLEDITACSGYAGTVQQANTVLSAYGRLWTADTSTDKTTVKWSDLLQGHIWTGGSSGSLDVRNIWDGDEIVTLADFNGFLVIFGRKNILVYEGATTPSTMALTEIIRGTGCAARDSVQAIGTDIFFLSDSGVRSLTRLVQERSMPMRDVSRNIHNDVIAYLALETTKDNIKSVYHEQEGFYLLTFPTSNVTYCFDVRRPTGDGTAPITKWDSITPTAYLSARNRTLYLGQAGYIGYYTGYQDRGSAYTMSYLSPWLDFDDPGRQTELKRLIATVASTSSATFRLVWNYDYGKSSFTEDVVVPGGSLAEFNVAEYNLSEWGGSAALSEVSVPGAGSGKMVQLGIQMVVNGQNISLQKLDGYGKLGSLR